MLGRRKCQVLLYLTCACDWRYVVWDEEAFRAWSCSQRASNQVAENKK